MAEKLAAAPADVAAALPTVQEHVERLGLAPWQVEAVLRRHLITRSTQISVDDFDAAVEVALHGRL